MFNKAASFEAFAVTSADSGPSSIRMTLLAPDELALDVLEAEEDAELLLPDGVVDDELELDFAAAASAASSAAAFFLAAASSAMSCIFF